MKIALVRERARRIEYPGVVLAVRRVKRGSIFIDITVFGWQNCHSGTGRSDRLSIPKVKPAFFSFVQATPKAPRKRVAKPRDSFYERSLIIMADV